jgi:Coenzyme PQQ synthesis protein D (PqqD)
MPTDRPSVLERLEVSEVKEGLIVYDPVGDRVHHLNATASIVFAMCDGEHDSSAIAGVMAAAFDLDHPPLDEVQNCLRDFADKGLLE